MTSNNLDPQNPNHQLQALWASIEHWHENFFLETFAQIYADTCPLCKLNYDSCSTCPIALKTTKKLCRETPWQKVANLKVDLSLKLNHETAENFRLTVLDEISFLVDLVFELSFASSFDFPLNSSTSE